MRLDALADVVHRVGRHVPEVVEAADVVGRDARRVPAPAEEGDRVGRLRARLQPLELLRLDHLGRVEVGRLEVLGRRRERLGQCVVVDGLVGTDERIGHGTEMIRAMQAVVAAVVVGVAVVTTFGMLLQPGSVR